MCGTCRREEFGERDAYGKIKATNLFSGRTVKLFSGGLEFKSWPGFSG
jgi:hypothetical protein